MNENKIKKVLFKILIKKGKVYCVLSFRINRQIIPSFWPSALSHELIKTHVWL